MSGVSALADEKYISLTYIEIVDPGAQQQV